MERILILAAFCHLLLIEKASLSIPEDIIESTEEYPVPSSTFEEPLMNSMWVTSLNPYIRYLGKRSNTGDVYISKEDDYRYR